MTIEYWAATYLVAWVMESLLKMIVEQVDCTSFIPAFRDAEGIGFNQEFGAGGPGHKCQVYVEGNDIEGNDGGQVNCDSLWGSTFKNNHLENQRLPGKSATIPPMSFGSRRVPKASSGTTTGKNMHFKIVERGTLTLNIDGGKDIKIPFETGDMKLSDNH